MDSFHLDVAQVSTGDEVEQFASMYEGILAATETVIAYQEVVKNTL